MKTRYYLLFLLLLAETGHMCAQDSAAIYYNMAKASENIHLKSQGLEQIKKSLAIKLTDSAYYLQGQLLYPADEAIIAYSNAIELNPRNAEAYLQRGNMMIWKLHDFATAESGYNKAKEIDPKNTDVYLYTPAIKVYLHQDDSIDAEYSKGIAIDPNSRILHTARCKYRERHKNYKGALEDYNKLIELDDNYEGIPQNHNMNLILGRGICRVKSGDKTGGCSDILLAKKSLVDINA